MSWKIYEEREEETCNLQAKQSMVLVLVLLVFLERVLTILESLVYLVQAPSSREQTFSGLIHLRTSRCMS